MKPYLIVAVLGAACLDALAQETVAETKVIDPATRVPKTTYRSAFENYAPYREQAIAPWRELNEEVAHVGGHAGIFRGAAHGAKGHSMPAKPASGEPAAGATEAGAQPPVRGAPQAPQGKPAAGSHHGH